MFSTPPPPPPADAPTSDVDEDLVGHRPGDLVTWTRHEPDGPGPGGGDVTDHGLVLAVDDEGHATIGWFTHVSASFPVDLLDGHDDEPAPQD